MAPKEPTKHQLSARLSYNQGKPAFLQKLQNRMAGIVDSEDEEDEEFEDDGSGRPPIPRRPAIPERPASQPGSEDEEDGDEKPQVVVLREGKHLTEREAENVRRRERGLPPLPDANDAETKEDEEKETSKKEKKVAGPSLSFSSSSSKASSTKRKRIITTTDDDPTPSVPSAKAPSKKKSKKNTKTLLSFGDEA